MIAADIDEPNAQETAKTLTDLGISDTHHTHFQVDVTSPEHVGQLMADIKKNYGRYPCISVNCHGITRDDFLIKMSEEAFSEVINVNLKVRGRKNSTLCAWKIFVVSDIFQNAFYMTILNQLVI